MFVSFKLQRKTCANLKLTLTSISLVSKTISQVEWHLIFQFVDVVTLLQLYTTMSIINTLRMVRRCSQTKVILFIITFLM